MNAQTVMSGDRIRFMLLLRTMESQHSRHQCFNKSPSWRWIRFRKIGLRMANWRPKKLAGLRMQNSRPEQLACGWSASGISAFNQGPLHGLLRVQWPYRNLCKLGARKKMWLTMFSGAILRTFVKGGMSIKTAFKEINFDMKILNPRSRVLKLISDWTTVSTKCNLES